MSPKFAVPGLCSVVWLAACSHAPVPAAEDPASRLVGAWRIVLFEDIDDGRKSYPFGEKPDGYLVYTADGHMAAVVTDPAVPSCVPSAIAPSSKVSACTHQQMERLLERSIAYWGTYSVDASRGVVVHHVERDLTSGLAGTDQPRPFRLEGDRLIIGDGKSWKRVFERAR